MSQAEESASSRVRVDQFVSALGAIEVSCSNDPSVASIGAEGRQVTAGILPDLWGLPYVAAAGGWPRWAPGLWYKVAAITWLR